MMALEKGDGSLEGGGEKVAILRFSALGDVAIAAPLVKAYAEANLDTTFLFYSIALLEPLFEGPPNLIYKKVELRGRHKGVRGMWRLSREIRGEGVTAVADFHSVLRSHLIALFLFLTPRFRVFNSRVGSRPTRGFIPFYSIDKGRKEKRQLTAKRGKKVRELATSMSRYESVLVKAGLPNLSFSTSPTLSASDFPFQATFGASLQTDLERTPTVVLGKEAKIGIAPFAKHKGKEWPLEKMEQLVAELSGKIYLFGGGAREREILERWENSYEGVESVAGKISFREELQLMGELDFLISMDSANMHFASAVGTPVLSIWGATHPFAGFYGWGQSEKLALMAPIECRPCSVFGNKECYRGDWACLNNLSVEAVLKRVEELTNFKKV